MTMLEKAARAIIEWHAMRGVGCSPEFAESMVETVLAAIREPDEAMLDAALSPTAAYLDIKGSALTVNREKMRRRWNRMLDAILS